MISERKPHTLKKLKRVSYPKHLIFFDVESYEVDISPDVKHQRMKIATACYFNYETKDEEWKLFRDKHTLSQYIVQKAKALKKVYIFAHNLFYDLKASDILQVIINVFKWNVKDVYNNSGRGLIIELEKDKKKIIFLDTMNFFNTSLKNLGKSIGLEKLDTDVFTDNEQELIKYNKRDVEILKVAIVELIDFLRKNNLGSFSYTIAGLSMKIFRHNFLKHRIFIHANKEIDELERKAYYGGRTEAFVIKDNIKEVYKLDINSMYPYVMKNFKVPVDLVGIYKGLPINVLKRRLQKGYLATAEVIIETDEEVYPYRKDGKLIFPKGKFKTYLNTPELMYAIEKGHLKKIIKVSIYKGEYVFKEFVDYFYNKRIESKKENNNVYSMFYKLILNSLYGKFAQINRIIEDEILYEDFDWYKQKIKVNNDIKYEVRIGNKAFIISRNEEPSFNSFISISAHITAYARIYLYKLMKIAKIENVYYCDTDSLFVNKEGYENLSEYIDASKIGMLKLEEVGTASIRGAKNYTFNETNKIKGIPKKSIQVSANKYEYWSFESFRGSLLETKHEGVYIKRKYRTIISKYDKRIVKNNGDTSPIIIQEF